MQLEHAVERRQQLGTQIARVEAFFEEPIKAAHTTHKLLCDRRREIITPLQVFDQRLVAAISEFKSAADREREAREREQADQQRRDEQARAAAEAAALESSGEPILAEAVIAESIARPMPVVALPDVTRVSGLQFRRYFRWRVAGGPNEIKLTPPLVLARALQLVPREFLCLDEKKLTKYAAAMQGSAKVAGIEFYFVDTPVR